MSSKLALKFFTVPEWEREQDYLRAMHRKGWRFVRYILPCFYCFESCEPEDVVYQLDYNEDGAARHSDEYFQLFRDCGWEFVQYFAGFSYFRKPASELRGGEEGIFSDAASRLDMMRRMFIARLLPGMVILLGYAVFCWSFLSDPYRQLTAGWDDWLALALFTALTAYVTAQLGRFAANYLRVRRQTRK